MRQATLREILFNLKKIESLKEICNLRGIPNLNEIKNRRKNFIELILSEDSPWSEEQKKSLIQIYNKEFEGKDKSVTTHFFISDNLSQKEINELKELIKENLVVVQGDKITSPGFDNIISGEGVITATFKGNKENLVSVGDSILKETKIVQIPIKIIIEQGIILMKGSALSHIRTCRDFSNEILRINKLYYSIPEGIKDEGVNARIYNSRAKDFVDSLPIEVINGVFLKIGDQTIIKRIDYHSRGGNILNEGEIKSKIRQGALIVGLKGYIRHNDFLVEFLIKWGHLCVLHVRGQISNAVLDEILMEIYKAYQEHMLQ